MSQNPLSATQKPVVTLWIPELLHPQRISEAETALSELKLPALQALIAKADKFAAKPQSYYQQASYLLHQPNTASIAAVKASQDFVGDDRLDMTAYWLCVDPVQMVADRDSLVLIPGNDLAIQTDEAEQLVEAFNQHFADDGLQLLIGSPQRWYLTMPQPVDLQTIDLEKVAYKPVNDFYPLGSAARYWRQLINETQMLFFGHPVNENRRLQGLPEINSVWVWGTGRLDMTEIQSRAQLIVASDEIYLKGLSELCGAAQLVEPENFTSLQERLEKGHSYFVHLGSISQQLDHLQLKEWVELLQQLEQQWFSPLLKALHKQQVSELLLDIGSRQRFHLTPACLKRFWRLKKRLSQL